MGTIKEQISILQPGTNAFSITPSNNAFEKTRGLYVGVSGDVEVEMAGGNTVIFTDLAAGVIHPLQVVKVLAGNTDATGIIGIL